MDYTAILSLLESVFSGTSGVFLIAAIGVTGIIGGHFLRMKSGGKRHVPKAKSYHNVVIKPYVDEEGGSPMESMVPKLTPHQEQF